MTKNIEIIIIGYTLTTIDKYSEQYYLSACMHAYIHAYIYVYMNIIIIYYIHVHTYIYIYTLPPYLTS